MAKFLFTEIEGVLVSEMARRTSVLLNDPDLKAFKPSVMALDKIVETTRAQVVITSRWRAMGQGGLRDRFRSWGVRSAITDVTPQEVEKYTALHHFITSAHDWGYGKIDSIAILDSEHVYREYDEYVVKADELKGLTDALADQAINMLINKKFSPQ